MNAPIFVIMRLTLREASRRRLLHAVVVLTLVLVLASAWSFGRLTSIPCQNDSPCSPTDIRLLAGTLVILITFMYSFIFASGGGVCDRAGGGRGGGVGSYAGAATASLAPQ